MQHNPFYYGGSIKESRLFVGRQREVAEISDAIAASASMSVVGERRVGKSSLLRYLGDPAVEEKNGLVATRQIFTYFDFLGYPTITPSELWRRLLADTLAQLPRCAAGPEEQARLTELVQGLVAQQQIDLADLEYLLRAFSAAEFNLVILLDEFDTAAANPNFDQAFFGGLRNLSRYSLSYIIASHRSLSDLSYAHPETIVSPFFNIFRRVTLGGFTADEVEALLAGSLQGTGIAFSAGDREMLDFLASAHPFFLQMAAYFLFNAHRYGDQPDVPVDYRWVLDRVRDSAAEHFRYYWECSEAGEKLLLATLALLEPDELEKHSLYPAEDDPVLRRLCDRVLVVGRHRPRIFSVLLGQWITETLCFVPVEDVDDIRVAVENAKIVGFDRAWLDTTQRLRRGFARLDMRAIANWLVSGKGAEALTDWIARLLKLAS